MFCKGWGLRNPAAGGVHGGGGGGGGYADPDWLNDRMMEQFLCHIDWIAAKHRLANNREWQGELGRTTSVLGLK